ncbi:MAG: acyl-CoA dehydrogenase family protein [Mycobacteriales bacterium]
MTQTLDGPAATAVDWPTDPVEAARRIGAEIAAPTAASVDAEARFPQETVDALAAAGLLQLLVPADAGGPGGDLRTAMRAVAEVGRHDASAGMILAMHLIQVACLVRHGTTPGLRALTAEVGSRPLLLASATTEAGVGGDVRTSMCAVQTEGGRFRLSKKAMVISYGEYAHGVLATARKDPDAGASDQVLVACLPPGLGLEPIGDWDVLGFRGTRSLGFQLEAEGPAELVFPDPYAVISSHTMLPTAHLLWSALWSAMAGAAVDRAAAYTRAGARSNPAAAASSTRLAQLVIRQQRLAAMVSDAAAQYAAVSDDVQATSTVAFALTMNSLKVAASNEVAEIVTDALRICGMAGYREGGPYSMGRLLRDAQGAALMVSNERILRNNAELLLVHKGLS